MRAIHAIGKKFGRLTVLSYTLDYHSNAQCEVVCECGTKKIVALNRLRRGDTKSCGCLRREVMAVIKRKPPGEGFQESDVYGIWSGIKRRCLQPNSPAYHRYGGRGIKICDRWRGSFEAFRDDMGPRPSLLHEIDRIDNDGNYEPGNCRWVTCKENNNNTSRNVFLTWNGKTQTVAQWAEEVGMNRRILAQRIRHGWPTEFALTVPVTHKKPKRCYNRMNRVADGEVAPA